MALLTSWISLASVLLMAVAAEHKEQSCAREQGGICDAAEASLLQLHSKQRKGKAIRSGCDSPLVQVNIRYKDDNRAVVEGLLEGSGTLRLANVHLIEACVSREVLRRLEDLDGVEVEEDIGVHVVMVHSRGETFSGEGRAEETPYGISLVKADEVSLGAWNPIICVVDTGYDKGHEDLPALGDDDGFDNYEQQWDVDGHGHGTHCAGTIGAIGENDLGVVGVIPNGADFYIGKGLSDSGSGSNAGVMAAVDACVTNGARIISMSLGGGGYSQTAADTYKEFYDQNILVIAAAGNSGNSALSYPASYPTIMSVAAVDSNKNKAGFSQFNDQVEISGPGVSVSSTLPGNSYASWSGTSMATPHVAGVAALVWSHGPNCTVHQIRGILLKTAEHNDGAGVCDANYGFGLVNAKAAIELLQAEGCGAGGPGNAGSDLAFGGCDQGDHVPAPTPPPPAPCPSRTWRLALTTDNYGSETSWRLVDSSGTDVAEGAGLSSGTSYNFQYCLDGGAYSFTIHDSYGDGICCSYGQGSYSMSVDGEVLQSGGEFESDETTEIPPASSTATTTTSTAAATTLPSGCA